MNIEKAINKKALELLFAYIFRRLQIFFRLMFPVVAGTALFDYFRPLPSPARFVLMGLITAFFLKILYDTIIFSSHRKVFAAEYIDKTGGQGRILGAYEFLLKKKEIFGSKDLVQAEIKAAEKIISKGLKPVPATKAPFFISVMWILIITVFLAFSSGKATYQAKRILFPWSDMPPISSSEQISWLWPPENFIVPPGGGLRVEAIVLDPQASPQLIVNADESNQETKPAKETGPTEHNRHKEYNLSPLGNSRWYVNLTSFKESAKLQIRSGPFRSSLRHVKATRSKKIKSIELILRFPAYTKEPVKRFLLDTDRFEVIEGTSISLLVRAESALSGTLTFLSGQRSLITKQLIKKGEYLTASLTISRGGKLEVSVDKPYDQKHQVIVECFQDNPPEVLVSFPPPLLIACKGSRVPIKINASDDFCLKKISIISDGRQEVYPVNQKQKSINTYFDAGTIDSAGGKVNLEKEIQSTAAITIEAEDNREPHANLTRTEPRTIKIVDRRSFMLLRKLNALVILKERLLLLRTSAEKILSICLLITKEKDYSSKQSGIVLKLLRNIDSRLQTLKNDPVFTQEKKLSNPILESAEGLAAQGITETPKSTEEIKKWISFVSYFANELLSVLNRIFPEAKALAAAQPFLNNLNSLLRIVKKQELLCIDIQKGNKFELLINRQKRIKLNISRISEKLALSVPPGLKGLEKDICKVLDGEDLSGAFSRALSSLGKRDSAGAFKNAEKAKSILSKIRSIIKQLDDFNGINIFQLLASLGKSNDALESLGIEPDSFMLWGPGADVLPGKKKKEQPRSGKLVFQVHKNPISFSGNNNIYSSLIRSYGKILNKFFKPKKEKVK